MDFKYLSESDIWYISFPMFLSFITLVAKQLKRIWGKSKGVPSIRLYKMNLWALDKKSFDPWMWMMALLTICWKILALLNNVPYCLRVLAQLGPHKELFISPAVHELGLMTLVANDLSNGFD